MMLPEPVVRAQRAQGLCESKVWTGRRRDQECRNRSRWKRRNDAPTDQGMRVCGVHARAFVPATLVEIGTGGWADA